MRRLMPGACVVLIAGLVAVGVAAVTMTFAVMRSRRSPEIESFFSSWRFIQTVTASFTRTES